MSRSRICSVVVLAMLALPALTAASSASRCPWDPWGSYYGPRVVTRIFLEHPVNKFAWPDEFHKGEDYHTDIGENLYPMEEGNIVFFDDSSPWSDQNFIAIEYDNFSTVYLHIAEYSVQSAIPELEGKAGYKLSNPYFVGENTVVAQTALAHLHVEVYDDGGWYSGFEQELVSPRAHCPWMVFGGGADSDEPEIDCLLSWTTVPIFSTVDAFFDAHDEHNFFEHGIYRWETYVDGSLQDRLTLDRYHNMEDVYILKSCENPEWEDEWFTKTSYYIGPEGSYSVQLRLYDFYDNLTQFTWSVTDIADIRNFTAAQEGATVHLRWEIVEGYDLTGVNLYRSDYEDGPFNRINTSVIEIPEHGYYDYYDDPVYDMAWYYKIEALGPNGGFQEADPFPISFTSNTDPPPIPRPVVFMNATDVPLDRGGEILVHWGLSPDDSLLTQYHIYRGTDGMDYQYFTSVDGGVASYIDTMTQNDFMRYYRVRGHNGVNGSYYLYADSSQAIDNFNTFYVTSLTGSNLFSCPSGEEDTLSIELKVYGSDGNPTVNIPTNYMHMYAFHDDLHFCDGDTFAADHPTDAGGATEFTYPYIGGCDQATLAFDVHGVEVPDTLIINIKSVDLNGDGQVNLSDFNVFGLSYLDSCGDPGYNECCDFTSDCSVDVSDLGIFGLYYHNSYCPE